MMMDETIERLRTVLREDPDSRQFVALGRALAQAGELEEAAQVLEEGLRRHPRLGEGWIVLAEVELERGNLKAVETACARALDVDSENAEAARLIARAASRRGDWKRALSAWRLTLALAPQDQEAMEGVARAERELAEPLERSAADEPAADRAAPAVPEAPPREERPPSSLPREVVTVTAPEDPFAVAPKGDTGVWFTGEDVFALEGVPEEGLPEAAGASSGAAGPDEAPDAVFGTGGTGTTEAAPEEVAGAVAVDEPAATVPEAVWRPAGEPAAEEETGGDGSASEASGLEVEAGLPAEQPAEAAPEAGAPASVGEPAIAEEAVGFPEPAPSDRPSGEAATPPAGMPLPTVTLARLALEQGDLELARRTLDQVVVLRGENEETRELAARIDSVASAAERGSVARRKIERLQGWMQAVRLAVESRDHGV